MSKSALHSSRLKLQRSAELLDEIESAFLTMNSDPSLPREAARYHERTDALTGRQVFIIRFAFDPPPPDERWGLLAGDAIHNARSALDHLACRLVEHNNRKISIRTSFPIWKTEPKDPTERKRFRNAIAGMSEAHKKSIRRLQPYANPGSDEATRLNTLRELDDLDKHKILVPMGAFIAAEHAEVPEFTFERPGQVDWLWNDGAEIVKGVEVLRVSPRGQLGRLLDLKLTVPRVPTFGDLRISVNELRAIRDLVVGIVESFAPDFP